ncbi:MAG: PorV/PorQ family protein [Bacteroidota bacterium]|nr:PorV/PorQ family protein [Bacteroidota bacterium]
MKTKNHIIKIFLLMFVCSNIFAQNDGAGNTGLAFLKLGVGARSIAMGEAYSSLSDDATAFIYNPARLNFGVTSNVSLMHNASVQDVNTDFIAAKFTLGSKLALGVGFFSTSVNDIEIRQIPGASIGTFDAQNLSTGVSLGYKINPNLSVGVTGKFLFEKIYVDEASGFGFDIGSNYSKDNFSFALVLSNLGSMTELKNQKSKLPSSIRLGGSYKYTKNNLGLTFGLDGLKVFDGGEFHVLAGGEAGYKDFVFLRLGYQTSFENKGISTGLGFKYKAFTVDYAFVPYQNEFGTSNTFSLGINF